MSSSREPGPRLRPDQVVMGFVLVIAGGAIGWFLGNLGTPLKASVERPYPLEPSAPVSAEIEALRGEMIELRRQLQASIPPSDRRVPAVPDDDGNANLLAAIERLKASVARLDVGPRASASRPHDPRLLARMGQDATSLDLVRDPESDSLGALSEWTEKWNKELRPQHVLWDIDEVLAAYGPPTRVEGDGSQIGLHYDVKKLGDGRIVVLEFSICSSRVVYTNVTWRNQ